MATVVYRQGNPTNAALSDSLANLGSSLAAAYTQRRQGEESASVIEALSSGKTTPLQATAGLLKTGMDPKDIDRVLSNVYQESQFGRKLASDESIAHEGHAIQREEIGSHEKIAAQSNETQRYGIDTQADTAEKGFENQRQLTSMQEAGANARAQANIASEERRQGRQLSFEEKSQIRNEAFNLKLEDVRHKNEVNSAIIGGAIQSTLSTQQAQQNYLLRDRELDVTRAENAKDRSSRENISSSGEQGATMRTAMGLGAQAQQNDKQRAFDQKLEEYRQGKVDKRTFIDYAVKANMDAQQNLFTANQNDKDRQLRREISGAEVQAARENHQTPEKVIQRGQRAQELSDAATANDIDLSDSVKNNPERVGAVVNAYTEDKDAVLKSIGSQLGIDQKYIGPDGIIANIEGGKVGGLERLKMEKANKVMSSVYAKAAAAGSGSYDVGTITSQVQAEADRLATDPKEVLPADLIDSHGNVTNPLAAAKFLSTNKGFTKNDVSRWFKAFDPGASDNDIQKILDNSGLSN